MPQARDEAGNIWEVDAQGNAVRLLRPAPQQGGVVVPDDPLQRRGDVADVRRSEVQADAEAMKAPAEAAKARADAQKALIEAQEKKRGLSQTERSEAQKELNAAFRTDQVLAAIREARQIAQEDGGTGWESLLKGVPNTDALRLRSALTPITANLGFDRLQQMRDESPTGGAVGNLTERELKQLSSTVADLEQALDLSTFLDRLDRIERSFIGTQLTAMGIDPTSDEGRQIFKQEYGYSGVFDGETPQADVSLADPNATQTAREIPEEYQQQHLRYLRDNWGQMTPEGYASFRSGLDEQFGFTPNPDAYAAAVPNFNDAAQEGVAPEQLGAVPAPPRDLSMLEQGVNYAAQSAPGTAFANATNAFAMGLPARLGGEQTSLELMRERRPVSSFIGEAVGQGAGALAMGGVAGRLGAGMLARPFGSEAATGTVYGATQDDDALRGAAVGLGGSLAGSYLGQRLGRAMPGDFAPDQMRAMEQATPTVDDLKAQAGELYAGVQARGNTAVPEQTQELLDRSRAILASQGRVGGTGETILQDGPTRQGYNLIESFAGGTMSPLQGQTVRETLGEGLTSNIPKERRIASLLLEDFDNWSRPVMPGAGQAREVSSRYIQGQQLQDLAGLGNRRGNRLKGNDVADSTRTLFGQLDEKVAKGQAFFSPATQDAISRTAQGDGLTNAARALGKYGFGSVLPTTGLAAGGLSSAFAQTDPLLMAVPATIGAVGTGARKLAERRTLQSAKEAEMAALLGDQEYMRLMDFARSEAGQRAGRALGGIFGVGGSNVTRERRPLPR